MLCTFVLVAGCGQTSSGPDQSTSAGTSPAKPTHVYDVEPASATRKIDAADDQVSQAVAIAEASPADTAVATADIAEPAALPVAPKGPLPLNDALDAESVMPQVALTEAHAKTCLVRVGDQLPNFELADLKGEKHPLGELMGAKLTVVFFWTGKLPTALTELADMQSKFQTRFGNDGVAIVGINSGDDPQLAAELVEQAGAKFTNLSDRDRAAFAQVAAEKMPRTYLVDPAGKILWFDIEYSRSTRRDLASAIQFSLAH